jgi:hypothetical protein
MQQLNQTGYMHNRLRMVTACFLIKDLGIDWRWEERYFARHLNDFDLSANNGGWQWAASSGCDAQRISESLIQSPNRGILMCTENLSNVTYHSCHRFLNTIFMRLGKCRLQNNKRAGL